MFIKVFNKQIFHLRDLSDIIDTPQESTESDKNKIPMPSIEGNISIDNLSFSFKKKGLYKYLSKFRN